MSYYVEGGKVGFRGSPAYKIGAAGIEEMELPGGGLEVAVSRCDLAAPLWLLPGYADPHWPSYSLAAVAELAQRLTPWATWYAAPSYSGSAEVLGSAWIRQGVAVVSSAQDPRSAVSTAYHEAWHLADDHLSLAERQAMDAAIARGPAWPTLYLANPWERRARLFQNWALVLHEGGCVSADRRAPESLVMARVYSGELGRRVVARLAGRRAPGWRVLMPRLRW